MEVGKYNKLPHYSVVGEKTSFYLWINEDGKGSNSNWIKGQEAFKLYNQLQNALKKDKEAFIKLVKEHYEKNRKDS